MTASHEENRIADDWYPGTVPRNIRVETGGRIETSYSFLRYRSREDIGLSVGRGAALYAPILDVGPHGRVFIGDFALISSAMILCDLEVSIGPMTMLAWSVVILDSYRGAAGHVVDIHGNDTPRSPRPVRIGANVWIGFEACVLPGTTIGDNSVVAARAVVSGNIPPNCVVAGNPAKIVRRFQSAEVPPETGGRDRFVAPFK